MYKHRVNPRLPDNLIAWHYERDKWEVIPLIKHDSADIKFSGTKEECINWCKSKNEDYEIVKI